MFRKLRRLLGRDDRPASGPPIDLPPLHREEITHLFVRDQGLPHVDWGTAEAWIAQRVPDQPGRDALHRAVAAAWLDELRDALSTDSRRWRRGIVEGLAPLEGTAAMRLADWAAKSIDVVGKAMRPIRGDDPIEPIGILGLGTHDEYYSFIAHYYREGGSFATSGGVYIRGGEGEFPILAIDAHTKHALEPVVAHELTHHILAGRNLPLWVEEGLTQMMEERVTGTTSFALEPQRMRRQREFWLEEESGGFERLIDGSGFHAPDGDAQELSYHLSEFIVRGLLTTHPKEFFAFARACASEPAEMASREHLGAGMDEIAERMLTRM